MPSVSPRLSFVPATTNAGGVGLSWDFICDAASVTRGLHFRAIAQLLQSLSALHTDVAKAPGARVHGALCPANVLFRSDGSVLLVRDKESLCAQPPIYRSPKVARGAAHDQHADL